MALSNKFVAELDSLKKTNDFPFEFNFSENDKNVINLELLIDEQDYPNIDPKYLKCSVRLHFNNNYPYSPPSIHFETPIRHSDIVGNQLIVQEWSPLHGPKSIFCNIYCIYLEYLDSLKHK